jgi:hypothetical protein
MPHQNRTRDGNSSGWIGIWLARCGAVALSSFAMIYLIVIVINGVVSGSVHVIGRYSSATASIQTEPVLFWVTVFYHLAISLLLSYFAYLCFVGGGWLKKSRRVDLVAGKLDAKFPDPRKPLPTWLSLAVLSCFFGFLLAMCAKGSVH